MSAAKRRVTLADGKGGTSVSEPNLGRGRPPKINVERYPCGRIKKEAKQAEGTPGAKIKRMVDMALKGAADPILATQLGWLRLEGRLTNLQVAAAEHYGRLRGRNDRDTGMPRREAVSPSYAMGFGMASRDEEQGDVRTQAMNRYDELRAKIRGLQPIGYGDRVLNVLDNVAIDDRSVPVFDQAKLVHGLDVCIRFFRLTN